MNDPVSDAIRRLFDGYQRGGVEGALGEITEDAVFVVSPQSSAEPDVYEGHPGARRYFAGFEGAIDDVVFELVEVVDVGPDTAVAVIRLSGIGTTTRIPVEQMAAMAVSIRDGLVSRIEAYADVESARAALRR